MTSSPDGGDRPAGGKLRPPGLGLLLAEMRGIFEFNASLMMSPLLLRAPKGDGHPVLALPGFLASDLSMAPMRRYLTELGYDAHAWQMGRNLGGAVRIRAALRERLAEIHASTRRKVTVIGWSLGGVYARDLALHAPDMVRYVVTLEAPLRTISAPPMRPGFTRRCPARRSVRTLSLSKRSPATCRSRRPRSFRAPTGW
jgi:pimeloyl-ACP methyl ester carboxylesterase